MFNEQRLIITVIFVNKNMMMYGPYSMDHVYVKVCVYSLGSAASATGGVFLPEQLSVSLSTRSSSFPVTVVSFTGF